MFNLINKTVTKWGYNIIHSVRTLTKFNDKSFCVGKATIEWPFTIRHVVGLSIADCFIY